MKAEHQRIDTFELWCWRRLLRVPRRVRRPNQSILKEINPEYSLERLMLKLKLQKKKKKRKETEALILWPPVVKLTHWKRPWYWERLMIGGEGDNRGWDGWMASPTQWTWIWANSGGWRWTGKPGMLQSMGSKKVGYDLSDWKMATTISWKCWFNSSSLRPSNSIFKNSCINLNV